MTADGTPSSPAAARQRNPRGQGQILREQLVEAATGLLATLDSPQALTLRMVARQVGIAPASVYSHFADLNTLVEHVLRLRYQELAEVMNRAAERASTPVEDLVGRCAAYLYWGTDNPGHYRVVFGGRAPSDVFPSAAHGAGAELLAGVGGGAAPGPPPPPPPRPATPWAPRTTATGSSGPGYCSGPASTASSRCTTTATTPPGRRSTNCSSS
jgi:AcrR family transcriptional regulator